MIKRLPFLLALALLAACARETSVEDVVGISGNVFTASFEECDTRLYSDADLHLRWNEDDRITIFAKSIRNQEYRFTGRDGAASGDFELVQKDGFSLDDPITHNIAIIPYSASNECDTEENVVLNFPAEQTWRENSFGPGAAVLLACSETTGLYFKHLGCYLTIQLSGEGRSVSSIVLRGNDGETLSGRMFIHFEDGVPVGEFDTSGTSDSITLTAETPVVLGAEPVNFWICVPPVTFEHGFSVTITGSDGWVETKTTDKNRTMGRGHLARMQAFTFNPHPTAPGIYRSGEAPILFPRFGSIANVYEAEGQLWSRYLFPETLTVYQIGPIPATAAVGDIFDAEFALTEEGVAQAGVPTTLMLVAREGGYAVLASEDNTYYVVRI